MNKEYEYCIKVESLDVLFEFLKDNNYVLKEKYNQTRKIYKNNSKVMARITFNKYDDKVDKILDFKDDDIKNKLLNVRRESAPLIITDDNIEFVKSMLEILGYEETTVLNRERSVYNNDNVSFEIDEYDNNDIYVSIEGKKEEVDRTFRKVYRLVKWK